MTRFRSVFSLILPILTILFQISLSCADNAVPVVMWGDQLKLDSETKSVNPFLKTTRKEFESFLRKKLESLPPVLVCVKDNLCIEDLVKHKQHLHSITTDDSMYYFPAVETAVNVIEDLPSYNTTYADYTDSLSEGQLSIMAISNLDIIPESYKTIKESSPNAIVILTGRSCNYRHSERMKRNAPEDNNSTFTVQTDRVMLYSSQRLALKIPEETDVILLPLRSTPTEEEHAKELILNLQFNEKDSPIFKHKLSFKFENKSTGYYTLKTVNYEYFIEKTTNNQNLTTNTDIVFPNKFSYHCSKNITFQMNGTYVLSIADLQVQVFSNKDPKRKPVFSYAYDCVGFTTIPIWTGIFVTAILASILMWGLAMIIDIRTMDRFDDPKGKTITVSALE